MLSGEGPDARGDHRPEHRQRSLKQGLPAAPSARGPVTSPCSCPAGWGRGLRRQRRRGRRVHGGDLALTAFPSHVHPLREDPVLDAVGDPGVVGHLARAQGGGLDRSWGRPPVARWMSGFVRAQALTRLPWALSLRSRYSARQRGTSVSPFSIRWTVEPSRISLVDRSPTLSPTASRSSLTRSPNRAHSSSEPPCGLPGFPLPRSLELFMRIPPRGTVGTPGHRI